MSEQSIEIYFCRTRTLGGRIIRIFQFTPYNHVAIKMPALGEEDDLLYFDSSMELGVAKRTKEDFYKHWIIVDKFSVCPSARGRNRIRKFLEEQLGKKYDWRAIVSLPFLANWQRKDAYICSELVAAALEQGGIKLPLEHYKVTPRDLYVSLERCEHIDHCGMDI